MEVNVLGRSYEVREATPDTDPLLKEVDGYCDRTIAVCVVDAKNKTEPDSLADLTAYKRSVIRHELIHAFLAESGLQGECSWACEEMVDWVANQFPKMMKAFEEAGCMEPVAE